MKVRRSSKGSVGASTIQELYGQDSGILIGFLDLVKDAGSIIANPSIAGDIITLENIGSTLAGSKLGDIISFSRPTVGSLFDPL